MFFHKRGRDRTGDYAVAQAQVIILPFLAIFWLLFWFFSLFFFWRKKKKTTRRGKK